MPEKVFIGRAQNAPHSKYMLLTGLRCAPRRGSSHLSDFGKMHDRYGPQNRPYAARNRVKQSMIRRAVADDHPLRWYAELQPDPSSHGPGEPNREDAFRTRMDPKSTSFRNSRSGETRRGVTFLPSVTIYNAENNVSDGNSTSCGLHIRRAVTVRPTNAVGGPLVGSS